MNDKTYGRMVIRGNANRTKRRLVASWGICFLIGFLIGCVLMSGIVHIFTCIDVVSAEEAPVQTVVCASEPEPEKTSLGVFKLTAYCACEKCCGKCDGITASGVKAVEGITIAADTKVLPFNTKVIIDGHEYTVQDVGGAIKGNRIDVYFDSHQKALDFGVQYKEIYTMKEGEKIGQM